MYLTLEQEQLIDKAINNFIDTYQTLDYDMYEDCDQYNLLFFMEQLDNAYYEESFNIEDLLNIKEDLFYSKTIKIEEDLKLFENFNKKVENNTITIKDTIPVYEVLDFYFSETVEMINNNELELIEDIQDYYETYFFEQNHELEELLDENQGYIDYKLDIKQLLKDDYDPDVYETNGNYYRIKE